MASPVESAIPIANTELSLDATTVTHDDGTEAEREGVFIGDPEDAAARALVSNEGVGDKAYVLGVSDKHSSQVVSLLNEILITQQGILKLLEAAFEDGLSGTQ